MNTFNITSVSASCPGCNENTPHRQVFEDKKVCHFRCESCQSIQVCAYKSGYLSDFKALDFSAVTKTAQGDDTAAYLTGDAFCPADLFEHPKFGTGYVLAVLSPPKKMEVWFADKARVLYWFAASVLECPKLRIRNQRKSPLLQNGEPARKQGGEKNQQQRLPWAKSLALARSAVPPSTPTICTIALQAP